MSRGSAGASDKALAGDPAVLRNAIDLYGAEHTGTYPAVATIATQLTQYSDNNGNTVATQDANHIYGPYLRTVPPLPVGAAKGNTGMAAATGTGVGWIYTASTGVIQANTTNSEVDAAGVQYNTY
jgi:hypothetical protein